MATDLAIDGDLDMLAHDVNNVDSLDDEPIDGGTYGRRNKAWVPVVGAGAGLPEAPGDGKVYLRNGSTALWQTSVTDGNQYALQDGVLSLISHDDLGDHTATENLKMAGFSVNNADVVRATLLESAELDTATAVQLNIGENNATEICVFADITMKANSLITVGEINQPGSGHLVVGDIDFKDNVIGIAQASAPEALIIGDGQTSIVEVHQPLRIDAGILMTNGETIASVAGDINLLTLNGSGVVIGPITGPAGRVAALDLTCNATGPTNVTNEARINFDADGAAGALVVDGLGEMTLTADGAIVADGLEDGSGNAYLTTATGGGGFANPATADLFMTGNWAIQDANVIIPDADNAGTVGSVGRTYLNGHFKNLHTDQITGPVTTLGLTAFTSITSTIGVTPSVQVLSSRLDVLNGQINNTSGNLSITANGALTLLPSAGITLNGSSVTCAPTGDIIFNPGGDVVFHDELLPNADLSINIGSASRRISNVYANRVVTATIQSNGTEIDCADHFYPQTGNVQRLGNSAASQRWHQLYLQNAGPDIASDVSLKKNFLDVTADTSWELLEALPQVKSYNWIDSVCQGDECRHVSWMAQDVETALLTVDTNVNDELVGCERDSEGVGIDGTYSLRPSTLIPHIVNAACDMRTDMGALLELVTQQAATIAALETRLAVVEGLVV